MNIKSAILTALLLIAFCLSTVFADENKVGTYNIGVGAGFVTGYGLSYRQWFGQNGVQLTLSPYYSSDSLSTSFTMSIGLVGLRMIKESRFVNLFAYYGTHFWYSYDKSTSYIYTNYSNVTKQLVITKDKKLFVGGGPGLDIHFWKLSLNVMCGLAFSSDLSQSAGLNFSGETGLYYSF